MITPEQVAAVRQAEQLLREAGLTYARVYPIVWGERHQLVIMLDVDADQWPQTEKEQ